MIASNFNDGFLKFVARVIEAYPSVTQLELGRDWLQSLYDEKGQDTYFVIHSLVEQMEPYQTKLEKKDFTFLLKNKVPLFQKLKFFHLYSHLTREEFKNFSSHLYNLWTLAKMIHTTDMENQPGINKLYKKLMRAIFASNVDVRKAATEMDPSSTAKLTALLFNDEGLKEDIFSIAKDMSLGKTSQLFKSVGVDREKLKSLTQNIMGEIPEEELEEMADGLLNPSEQKKNLKLADLMAAEQESEMKGTTEKEKEEQMAALRAINERFMKGASRGVKSEKEDGRRPHSSKSTSNLPFNFQDMMATLLKDPQFTEGMRAAMQAPLAEGSQAESEPAPTE
jgi:hypothetical protein